MNSTSILKFKYFPISVVTLGFLISVAVKACLVSQFQGPIILEDEFEYKQNAWHIFAGIPGFFIYYIPPLYPLFLSIAFLFDNFYLVMKIENVILTSLAIFPCYLLLRLYIEDKKASAFSLIILFLPIHYSMNLLILSENLFFPLFVLFVYLLVLTLDSFSITISFFTGVVLGLLLLTRYFGVALAPAVVILFGYVLFNRKDKLIRQQAIKSLLIISLVSAILYLPWVFYAYSNITKNVNAFFIASNENVRPISQSSTILIWLIRYTCYLALMIGPFLSILVFNGVKAFQKKDRGLMRDLYVIAISISICFLCLAAYQLRSTDIFNRYINGRYITYLNVPWLLIGGITIAQPNFRNLASEKLLLGCSLLLSFAIIYFAYLVNIKGIPWKTSTNYISSFNFMEGFLFVKHSRLSLVFFLFLNLLLLYAIVKEKSKYVFLLLPYFLVCVIPHIHALEKFINQPFESSYRLFRNVSVKAYPVNIYYTTRFPIHHLIIKNYFPFFNVKQDDVRLTQVEDIYKVKESGFIVTDTKVSHVSPRYIYNAMYVYDSPIPKDLSVVYSFADEFQPSVIKSKIIEMDTPWKKSISLLENKMIFAGPESELTYTINLPNKSNLKLRVYAAYHPLARNWHVTDGTRMQIVIHEGEKKQILIFDRLVQENDEIPFEYSLANYKGKSIHISFLTLNDNNSNILGDWSVWINPIIVKSE